MDFTIRKLQDQEMLDALYALNSYSLHSSPPFPDRQEWDAVIHERRGINCMAALEGDQAVSIAVSTPQTQNMRGKLFPAAGVWGVSTAPQARRKGYCKQAIAGLLHADREAGKVFTNLYPFRESFYERMGYVAYPLAKIVKIQPHTLSPLLKMDLGGELKLEYLGPAYDSYREYLARMREHQHGMAFFDFGDRVGANRNVFWAAAAVFDGKPEGFMLYRLIGDEPTRYLFSAIRFYYQSVRARYLLLNWIARHIDQAEQVELRLAAGEYPEIWLSDLDVKVEYASRPAMSRVLDVEKIGGMLVGEGAFSARIIDALCPWNEGAWRFSSEEGRLVVSKANTLDCELTIQGLTALILGIHDLQDIPLRLWGNPDIRLQDVMQAMFPKKIPYMHEMF